MPEKKNIDFAKPQFDEQLFKTRKSTRNYYLKIAIENTIKNNKKTH